MSDGPVISGKSFVWGGMVSSSSSAPDNADGMPCLLKLGRLVASSVGLVWILCSLEVRGYTTSSIGSVGLS